MLHFKTKLKYALIFALCFAVLTGISFLAGLFLNIQMAPPPVAQGLVELTSFTPIMVIAAFILGLIQTFINLWIHHAAPKWLWPISLIIAILIGGAASFFSLWVVWACVTLSNALLTLVMIRFLELRLLKTKA